MRKVFREIDFADTFLTRFLGLMGRRVRPDYALVFPKCRAVHCLFMREAIDVVFLDESFNVLSVECVKPWRMALGPAGTEHVLECAAGEAARRLVYPGVNLVLAAEKPTFSRALEDASCWLGFNTTSSCISKAYSSKSHWWFASAPGYPRLTTFVAVSKHTGRITVTSHTLPRKDVEEIDVPWQYSANPARSHA